MKVLTAENILSLLSPQKINRYEGMPQMLNATFQSSPDEVTKKIWAIFYLVCFVNTIEQHQYIPLNSS